jgi:hypothetical protein
VDISSVFENELWCAEETILYKSNVDVLESVCMFGQYLGYCQKTGHKGRTVCALHEIPIIKVEVALMIEQTHSWWSHEYTDVERIGKTH